MVRGLRASIDRIGALVAGAVAGGVLLAAPAVAAADVTLRPQQAPRGAGVMVTFVVPQERPGAHTTEIRLDLPVDLPIAEVYPMSVQDWAPRITNRRLAEPLPGLHGGQTIEVTESIVWLRVTSPPVRPEPIELVISIGPLPDTDRVDFAVTQTYSDGTEVRWGGPGATRPAPALTLVAADPAAVAGHGGHAGATGADPSAPATAAPESAADGGTTAALLLTGLAGGAAFGAVAVWWFSRRRSTTVAAEGDDGPADSSLVAAGSAGEGGRWRLPQT
ncbi:DUF1775 domain-containing protein [Solwaraspora sp. WMMD406]|uniref:DUF1775 domain-containing protein n=1 Tax=Solwaraspora sp. WMMD406 TaxID=3016095 RepID=UPI00241648E4|nr:DUF1775 domain-containing protein [Solwaraspora sp. WMMD406]MDG4766114.1 DUF1775 domain-containing protein [Solwaraspora sp. WMMD406]